MRLVGFAFAKASQFVPTTYLIDLEEHFIRTPVTCVLHIFVCHFGRGQVRRKPFATSLAKL